MKKLMIWLLLSAMLCGPCLGEEAGQPFTLRGDITVGLSMDEVMNREAARGIELSDSGEDYAREMRVTNAYANISMLGRTLLSLFQQICRCGAYLRVKSTLIEISGKQG